MQRTGAEAARIRLPSCCNACSTRCVQPDDDIYTGSAV